MDHGLASSLRLQLRRLTSFILELRLGFWENFRGSFSELIHLKPLLPWHHTRKLRAIRDQSLFDTCT